ncbi:MAG: hypothetical protein ABIT10_02840 [Alteraurantiacibacter sp.]
MKLSHRIATVASLAMLLASPSVAQEAPADHTPAGSEVTIPAPPTGMGQVVFYRTGSMMGMAMGCQVNEGEGTPDEAKLSSLGNGKYFIYQTTPGSHDFWVRNERRDALTLLVEDGETQFVRCKIKMGLMSGRPDIRPSDTVEFVEGSGSVSLVDDDDMLNPGVLRAAQLGIAPDAD